MNTTITRRHRCQRTLGIVMLLVLLASSLASVAPFFAEPAHAQPLCLDGKVWSEEEQACVDPEAEGEDEVTEPTVESEPTEEEVIEPTGEDEEEDLDEPVDEGDDEDAGIDDADDEEPTAEATEDPNAAFSTTSLVIHMLFCDASVSEATTDQATLDESCGFLPGVSAPFTVSVAGQTVASGNADLLGASGPYGLNVPSVPEGDVTIIQGSAPGYRDPVVYCVSKDETNAVIRDWTNYPAANGTAVVESLPPGTHTFCYFYQIQGQALVTLDVLAYTCPQAIAEAGFTSYEDLLAQCEVTTEELEIQVSSSSGLATQFTTAGLALFTDVSPGNIDVRQVIPDGYGAPYAFCTVTGPNGQTLKARDLEILYDDYTVKLADIPAPAAALCEFFNVPGETAIVGTAAAGADDVPGDVAISNVLCPYAFSYDWTAEMFAERCTEPLPGVIFRLEQNGAAFASGTTDAGGKLILTASPPPTGAFQIVSELPDDYTESITFCAPEPEAGEDPQSGSLRDTRNRAVTFDDAGAGVDCTWYNMKLVPADYGSSTLSVTTFGCPNGTNPESTDPLTYVLECTTPMPGLEIEVSEVANAGQSADTSQNPPTSVFFDKLPDWQILVEPTRPASYLRPVAFCLVEDANGTVVMPLQRVPVDKFTQFPITLGVGGKGTCELYYVPGQITNLIVFKLVCPDPDTGVVRTHEEWFMLCTEYRAGIEFSVSQNGAVTETLTTGEYSSGAAFFTDLEPAPVTLTEHIPSAYGTPVVWCYDYLPGAQGATAYVQQAVVNGSIEFTPVAGQERHCFWFNQPVTTGIDIWKYDCPPGLDHESATFASLGTECAPGGDGITFTVSDGATVLATQKVGETYANRVVFPTYPGPVTVTESIPAGYAQPVVYCTTGDPATATEADWERMSVSTGAISLAPTPAGTFWTCHWFNLPTEDGHIEIHKWQCPPELDPRAELADLLMACTTPMNDVTFDYEDDTTTSSQATANGIVRFEVPESGSFRIAERIPEGYGYPVVYCSYRGDTQAEMSFPERYELEDGNAITGPIPFAGFQMYCDWFNIPVQPGHVTIYKWTCPAGYDLHAHGADPEQDCTEATDGVTFTIEGEGYESASATGDSQPGAVTWGDLPPGQYTVRETLPESMHSTFVLDCSGGRVNGIQSYPLTEANELPVEIVDADRIVCNWYNVPESNEGRVTVTAYWCTTATWESDLDCQVYEDGVHIELRKGAGEVVASGTTSERGTLSLDRLAPGTYDLAAAGEDWCRIDTGSQGGASAVAVRSGEVTAVKVYACGIDPPASSGKLPTKYPNTGVDPGGITDRRPTP
jgi:hypothetical protein